jgi:hypothetical protein
MRKPLVQLHHRNIHSHSNMPTKNTSSVSTAEDWSNIQLGGLNHNQFRGDEVETYDLELGKAFQLCEYFQVAEYKIYPQVEKQVYFFGDPLALPCTVVVLKRSATRLMDRATKAKAKIDPPPVLEINAYPDDLVTLGSSTSLTHMEAVSQAQGADERQRFERSSEEHSITHCRTQLETTTVSTPHKPPIEPRRQDSLFDDDRSAQTMHGTAPCSASTVTAH